MTVAIGSERPLSDVGTHEPTDGYDSGLTLKERKILKSFGEQSITVTRIADMLYPPYYHDFRQTFPETTGNDLVMPPVNPLRAFTSRDDIEDWKMSRLRLLPVATSSTIARHTLRVMQAFDFTISQEFDETLSAAEDHLQPVAEKLRQPNASPDDFSYAPRNLFNIYAEQITHSLSELRNLDELGFRSISPHRQEYMGDLYTRLTQLIVLDSKQ